MTIAELEQQLGTIYGGGDYGATSGTGYGGWEAGTGSSMYGPVGTDYWAQAAGETPLGSDAIASSWADLFDIDFEGSTVQLSDLAESINPVTYKELMGARYGSMRPGMEKGMTSLTGELSRNLANIKSGGFESSGFVDKSKQAARDIFGKKASDILISEATKRSDYMGSLLDRATAEKELFSGWSSLGT